MKETVKPQVGYTVTAPLPFDRHVHFRTGDLLRTVVVHTARRFCGGIIMPNIGGGGKPHVYGVKEAEGYRDEIQRELDACGHPEFVAGLTLYLTEDTHPDEVIRAFELGLICAVKLYPANATTNSAEGVADISKCADVFRAMADAGIPLLIHGETPNMKGSNIINWERDFMAHCLMKIRDIAPGLRISLEHISTTEAVTALDELGFGAQATITPQHLVYSQNDLLGAGLRPDIYCKPIVKLIEDVVRIRKVTVSGSRNIRLGTDSAPHVRGKKYCACGCAGCFSAPNAISVYANVFERYATLGLGTSLGMDNFRTFTRSGLDFYPGIEDRMVTSGSIQRTMTLEWVESVKQSRDTVVGLGEDFIVSLPHPYAGEAGWETVED